MFATMLSMDWTMIGALGGVAVLVVDYGSSILIHSRPEPTREYQSSTVLIPAHDKRPAANPTATSAEYAQDSKTERTEIFDTAEPSQNPSHRRVWIPLCRSAWKADRIRHRQLAIIGAPLMIGRSHRHRSGQRLRVHRKQTTSIFQSFSA
jgi:hypothetical protein